ncbi:MAG: IS66 family transposase, partial [Anaerolineales bacterium]
QRLQQQLRYRQRQTEEGFFGSSTPSSKIPLKPQTPEASRSDPGGAAAGHTGHGRKTLAPSQADRLETIPAPATCPDCGGPFQDKGIRLRSVMDCPPLKAQSIVYRLEKKYCPRCRRSLQARAPSLLPKHLLGNQLLTRVLLLHYRDGIPLGTVSEQLGLALGTLVQMLHRLAALFHGVADSLIQVYRRSPVRHADETGWRTDGKSGYAWLFCTPRLSLFLFRNSRSAQVPHSVLGSSPLDGVLVVDRYNGYNRVPCDLQYCFAHLLREVQDLAKEFPDHPEVATFAAIVIPLLAAAMHLRSQPLSELDYYAQASQLQQQIQAAMAQPARHLGIHRLQDLFTAKAHRLYHWVKQRDVPADNNRAERELRPTVIARKVSFGSQSDAGAKTRETLMSLVHTLHKRVADPEAHLKRVLDQLALNPKLNPVSLLFPPDTS